MTQMQSQIYQAEMMNAVNREKNRIEQEKIRLQDARKSEELAEQARRNKMSELQTEQEAIAKYGLSKYMPVASTGGSTLDYQKKYGSDQLGWSVVKGVGDVFRDALGWLPFISSK